jgi:hypothetical protein
MRPAATALVLGLAAFALACSSGDPSGVSPLAKALAGVAPGAKPAATSAGTPAASAASTALPAGVARVQQVEIRDETGFGRSMRAATLLVPAGWTTGGAVVWNPHGACGGDYGFAWKATAPDGVSGLEMVAAKNWSGTRSAYPAPPNPCGDAFHTSAREYLEATATALHPGARVLEYAALPDDARPYQEVLAQTPQMDTPGMQTRSQVDAGELLIGYVDGGRAMRALLSATVFINQTRVEDLMNPGQVGFESVAGFPGGLTIVRAPDGQLDRALRKRVLGTVRMDPAWSAAVADFHAKKQRAFSDNMAAGHRARMDAIKQTGAMITGAYEDRMLASDRAQRERIEAIRGVETYKDPDGHPVQLDATYQNAWRASDGTYLLTNDPSFAPSAFGLEAQKLEVLE